MISIKKNKNIKLDIPSFTCDNNAVGSHLNNHDLTKYLNVYGFLCVIGRPGSGKTSMTIAMITQKKPKWPIFINGVKSQTLIHFVGVHYIHSVSSKIGYHIHL